MAPRTETPYIFDQAREIADRLPDFWHVTPSHPAAILINDKTEVILYVRELWNNTARFEIRATHVERQNIRYPEAPSITVSRKRTPAAIAADITRRLLPDATQWTQDVKAAAEREAHRIKTNHKIYNYLADSVTDGRKQQWGSDYIDKVYFYSGGNPTNPRGTFSDFSSDGKGKALFEEITPEEAILLYNTLTDERRARA